MPILAFYDPTQPLLEEKLYWTTSFNDPNIPAGYVYSQGSDGAIPMAMQRYRAGLNNQGAGAVGYRNASGSDGDPNQRTNQPNWPNGILGTQSGNTVREPGV